MSSSLFPDRLHPIGASKGSACAARLRSGESISSVVYRTDAIHEVPEDLMDAKDLCACAREE
jgi:hypothetical protein